MKTCSETIQGSNQTREGLESPGFSRGEEVNWGMYVLLTPSNKVVDPDADTLEDHPDTVAARKDRERMDYLEQHSVIAKPGQSIRLAIDAAMALAGQGGDDARRA